MQKIIARIDDENGCPLYKVGDGMEFMSPSVLGINFAPVCMRAVFALAGTLLRIQHGENLNDFRHIYCGGCTEGQAWFTFKSDNVLTVRRLTPDFAQFALNALSNMKIFHGIRPQLLERILPMLREKRPVPGEEIIRAGEPGRSMHIIVSGAFEVVKTDHEEEHVLVTLGPGETFGEMSLITGDAASASVRCKEAGILLEISRDDFPRLVGQVPALGLTLARILSARLNNTNSSIAEQAKKGLIGRLEMIPPAELIQSMAAGAQTGTLQAWHEGRTFSLYIEGGQPMDGKLGTLVGEAAAYEFLGWHKGPFRFEPGKKDIPRTILLDSVGLLLEGMRRRDEAVYEESRRITGGADSIHSAPTRRVASSSDEPIPQPPSDVNPAEIAGRPTEKVLRRDTDRRHPPEAPAAQ